MNIKYTDKVLEDLAIKLEAWMAVDDNYWLGDFAVKNNMSRQALSEQVGKNATYDMAYVKAKAMQESKIFINALTNKWNPSMAIFALKNVSGWRDKQEHEHTGLSIEIKNVNQTNDQHPNRRISIQRT